MLLGKRPRPPLKKTSSMTEITFDLGETPSDHNNNNKPDTNNNNNRRHSADLQETPHFLRACSLCKRRLVPARDIYMYRGDSAFCSLECRQHQMNQDERKDRCLLPSNKKSAAAAKSETVAAAV